MDLGGDDEYRAIVSGLYRFPMHDEGLEYMQLFVFDVPRLAGLGGGHACFEGLWRGGGMFAFLAGYVMVEGVFA